MRARHAKYKTVRPYAITNGTGGLLYIKKGWRGVWNGFDFTSDPGKAELWSNERSALKAWNRLLGRFDTFNENQTKFERRMLTVAEYQALNASDRAKSPKSSSVKSSSVKSSSASKTFVSDLDADKQQVVIGFKVPNGIKRSKVLRFEADLLGLAEDLAEQTGIELC